MFRLIAAAVAASVALAGSAVAQTQNWDQVTAAAKKEGRVIVFSGYVGAPTNKAISQAFEKKYGIQVDFLEFRGLESRERVRVEQAASRYTVDVMHNAVNQLTPMRDTEKTLEPHGGIPNAKRVRAPFEVTDHWVPIFTTPYGIMVNTNLVKAGDEPRSWADLADPKWKGKILMDDPRAPGGGYVMFFATHDKLGRGFQDKLADQSLNLIRDYREAERRVARGEFPIYAPFILSDTFNLKGLPIKYVVPSEGITYATYAVALLNHPPHPNAARLLMDFFVSDEGQTIYAKEAHGVVIDGIADKMPQDIQAMTNVKLLGTNDPARADEMYGLAREIYKKY
jgi:iron(III) transport system substrate-binding protein